MLGLWLELWKPSRGCSCQEVMVMSEKGNEWKKLRRESKSKEGLGKVRKSGGKETENGWTWDKGLWKVAWDSVKRRVRVSGRLGGSSSEYVGFARGHQTWWEIDSSEDFFPLNSDLPKVDGKVYEKGLTISIDLMRHSFSSNLSSILFI